MLSAVYRLDRSQRIEAPLEEVFAFFSDPSNLAAITPPWLRFRICGVPPSPLAEGSRIEYRIRWASLCLRWVTRITRWNPPAEFADLQEEGPYAFWVHTHRFRAEEGGATMEDHVEYSLPFGLLGRFVHALSVRRRLEAIFDYRRTAIADLFSSGRER